MFSIVANNVWIAECFIEINERIHTVFTLIKQGVQNDAHNTAFHSGRRGLLCPGHGTPASQHTRASGSITGTTPEPTLPLTRRLALRSVPRRSIRRAPPCRHPARPPQGVSAHHHQHTTFSRAC